MTLQPQQLSLGVSLNDDASLENFYCSAEQLQNALVVNELRVLLDGGYERFLYLWGASGSGLSHLLLATCREAQKRGFSFHYLPMKELIDQKPEEIFNDLELLDLVCIDDVHLIAGKQEWELALFAFFNAARDRQKRLLITANQTPRELPLRLEDLRSRLQWGSTYQVMQLKDADKQAALQLRAKVRGLELSDDVAQFLILRLSRDTHVLFSTLAELDAASLAEQRKLTIPFVKKTLNL